MPKGWTVGIFGAGKPAEAAFVGPDDSPRVQLRVEPAKDAKPGTYHMVVAAVGDGGAFDLPIDLTLAKALPPKLKVGADFPSLKGTPSSTFDYTLKLTNESDRDALVALSADAPAGFQVSITEQYGTNKQDLTSLTMKAGEDKTLKAKVSLPDGVEAGKYDVVVNAATEGISADLPLTLQVTGQPKLSLSGPDGRLSGSAYAGEEAPLDLVLVNRGNAPARDVHLASSEPGSWKVAFTPKDFKEIAPTHADQGEGPGHPPAAKAIAGDYMVTFRANGDGASASSDYRVTVRTSTLWGIVGIIVIAAALMVMLFAVRRYGRR